MKKQLLTGAFILASFFTANAQGELISVDFGTDQESYEEQTADWGFYAFDEDGSFMEPFLDDPDAAELGFEGVSIFSASFINEGTEEAPQLTVVEGFNFLASPAIDMTELEEATLTFSVGNLGQENSVMGYQVLVMTDADWEAEEFENMFIATEGTVAEGVKEDITVDLSEFTGEEVRLLFLHNGDPEVSSGIGFLILDNIVVTSEDLAGRNEVLASKLSVFPNPASNVVNITNAENILINNVVVADINGRTVKTVNFNGAAEAQINISDLASGVYMMTVASDKGTTTKKIVKN